MKNLRHRYRIREYWWGLDTLYEVQFYGPHKKLIRTGLFRKELLSFDGWYTLEDGFDCRFEAEEFIQQDMRLQ